MAVARENRSGLHALDRRQVRQRTRLEMKGADVQVQRYIVDLDRIAQADISKLYVIGVGVYVASAPPRHHHGGLLRGKLEAQFEVGSAVQIDRLHRQLEFGSCG